MPVAILNTGTFNVPVITDGSQLIAPFTGSPSSALNLAANVGPNALLQSAAYPLPSSIATGPLTTVPFGAGQTTWRVDGGGSGQFSMPSLWTPANTAAYAYTNSTSNLGGIIPAGGLVIDGYFYPAGTYVFQFMDFSQGMQHAGGPVGCAAMFLASGGPSVLFRGCRFRGPTDYTSQNAVFHNDDPNYTGFLGLHYCEFGGINSANANQHGVCIQVDSPGGRCLRNYISYTTTAIFLNTSDTTGTVSDVIENYIEKLTWFYGSAGPPGAGSGYHINGISFNGGNLNCSVLRNHVTAANPDEAGNLVEQTDCIYFNQDFGTFPGTGTNTDGTTGYQVRHNYAGGTGFPFYAPQSTGSAAGTVANFNFFNNKLTTASFASGGFFGPIAQIPPWGQFSNAQGANLWGDGASAGNTFVQFTVTATQGGATQAGMAIVVMCFSGAAAVQPGQIATAETGLSLAITPAQNGSLVAGAILAGRNTFAPLGTTTFAMDQAQGGSELGAFYSAAATTAGTPVTLGSGPTGSSGSGIALAEIVPAAGATTFNAGALVPAQTSSGTSLVTEAFGPAPGDIMVAAVVVQAGAGVTTMSITDTSGFALTWTEIAKANASGDGYAGLWAAHYPATG